MSLAAERAYEKKFEEHLEECRRTLTVGTKVYRVYASSIQEGVVRRVSRAYYTRSHLDPIEDEKKGDHDYWVAQFDYDWEGQTFQWRWFVDVQHARRALIRGEREIVDDLRRQIARREAIIAEQEALLPEGPAPWRP